MPSSENKLNTIPVGGIPTPLKNMKVSWAHYSQLNGKNMFQTTNQSKSCWWQCQQFQNKA
jgi:hypothetical protein